MPPPASDQFTPDNFLSMIRPVVPNKPKKSKETPPVIVVDVDAPPVKKQKKKKAQTPAEVVEDEPDAVPVKKATQPKAAKRSRKAHKINPVFQKIADEVIKQFTKDSEARALAAVKKLYEALTIPVKATAVATLAKEMDAQFNASSEHKSGDDEKDD